MQIKCPKCKEVFELHDSDYAQIITQIRDNEFEVELRKREQAILDKKENDLELIRIKEEQQKNQLLNLKNAEIADKEKQIAELKARLNSADSDKKLAVMEAVNVKEKQLAQKSNEIALLNEQLKAKETENELSIKTLKEGYESKIKDKDEQIEYYKDFKARQSTKMIGESLEQHCLNQFNSLRMTAFPNAYFEKDNDARTGRKATLFLEILWTESNIFQ